MSNIQSKTNKAPTDKRIHYFVKIIDLPTAYYFGDAWDDNFPVIRLIAETADDVYQIEKNIFECSKISNNSCYVVMNYFAPQNNINTRVRVIRDGEIKLDTIVPYLADCKLTLNFTTMGDYFSTDVSINTFKIED